MPMGWAVFGLLTFAAGYLTKTCNQDKNKEKEKATEQSTYQKSPKNSDSVTCLYGQDNSLHQGKLVSENNDSTK